MLWQTSAARGDPLRKACLATGFNKEWQATVRGFISANASAFAHGDGSQLEWINLHTKVRCGRSRLTTASSFWTIRRSFLPRGLVLPCGLVLPRGTCSSVLHSLVHTCICRYMHHTRMPCTTCAHAHVQMYMYIILSCIVLVSTHVMYAHMCACHLCHVLSTRRYVRRRSRRPSLKRGWMLQPP